VLQKDKTKEPTKEEMNGSIVESLHALFELIKDTVPKNWLRFD